MFVSHALPINTRITCSAKKRKEQEALSGSMPGDKSKKKSKRTFTSGESVVSQLVILSLPPCPCLCLCLFSVLHRRLCYSLSLSLALAL